MMQPRRMLWKVAIGVAAALALSACSLFRGDNDRAPGQSRADAGSSSGGSLFGGGRDNDDSGGIGVNSYLWRAALDTLSFMPLVSADPFGGVIITDWFSDPSTPNERFKATVFILDTRLRADALNVSIFRQQQASGAWVDAAVDPETEVQIENAILQKARQLLLRRLEN